MFRRSVEKFGIRYKKYIGDGDSRTFKNLLEADVYNGNSVVEKKECVLHVKKRIYRRIKEAKKSLTHITEAKEAAQKKELKKKEKLKKNQDKKLS